MQEKDTETVSDVTKLINSFSDFLPESWVPHWEKVQSIPFLGFLIIVILGYLASKLVVNLIVKSVRQVTKRTRNNFDDELVKVLRRPVFLTVFFFFVGVAVKSLGLSAGVESALIKFLASVVTITWISRGFAILHLGLNTISNIKDRFEFIQQKTLPLFEIIGKILIIAIGSYCLLVIWGINPTAWLASAGVVGIAVGFAAKDTLANLFSGFFIIADAPYKVGDFVNLPTGERGMVTKVGMRSTRLLTRDDIEITVPNNVIGNAKIINESGGRWEKSRIRIAVGVAYGSDVDQVCEVLMDVANAYDDVVKTPEPRVRMRGFGASSLDFELLVWIAQPVLRGKIAHDLYMAVYKALNAAEIEIPYNKTDVYIKSMPEARAHNPAGDD